MRRCKVPLSLKLAPMPVPGPVSVPTAAGVPGSTTPPLPTDISPVVPLPSRMASVTGTGLVGCEPSISRGPAVAAVKPVWVLVVPVIWMVPDTLSDPVPLTAPEMTTGPGTTGAEVNSWNDSALLPVMPVSGSGLPATLPMTLSYATDGPLLISQYMGLPSRVVAFGPSDR